MSPHPLPTPTSSAPLSPPCAGRRVRSRLPAAALLACCAACFAPAALAAATPLRPGLWDYALQTRTGDGPAMNLAQMLRSLPPSARPQIEAKLRQQGMSISRDGGLQICLDATSLASGHPPLHLHGGCAAHWSQPRPGDWKFRYTCPASKVTGSGSLRIASATSYASSYTVTTPQGSMSGQSQAHWVAPSCGSVPPLRNAR